MEKVRRFLGIGLVCAFAFALPATAAWRNGHPAKVILNEEFNLNNAGNIYVTDAVSYGSEILIVPDRDRDRFVVYKTAPTSNDASFDFAIQGADAAPTNGFNDAFDACIGPNGELVLVDRTYNRVLIWKTFPDNGSTKADIVLGQDDFDGKGPNRGDNDLRDSNTFSSPEAVAVYNGKLLVADAENHRVLVWNTFPTRNGQPADVVVGQHDFTSAVSNVCNQIHTAKPRGLAVSPDGKLLVSSHMFNRVLVWNSIPTTNGKPADVVIGQTDFTSSNSGTTATTLNVPIGVAVSRDGKLAVADRDNMRVLIWNSIPTTNGKAADVVIGQRDFDIGAGHPDKFDIDDIRYVGRVVGCEWTADGRLWVMNTPDRVRLFDPNFAPDVPEYVKPAAVVEQLYVVRQTTVDLNKFITGGKGPFRWRRDDSGPTPGTFDPRTGILNAELNNIHDGGDRRPQIFIAEDAKGNSVRLSVIVHLPLQVSMDYNQSPVTAYSGPNARTQVVQVFGGANAYGEPYSISFEVNASGATLDQNIDGTPTYTPGPTVNVRDVLVVTDKAGNKARLEIDVRPQLRIVGFNVPFENITMKVGETRTFSATGGTGRGYRWGNYNNYHFYNGRWYGNGTINQTTGEYTARAVGQDAVYVVDSNNNAFTVNITIVR